METIGDAYLAVTGLPRPQEDHALLMARFASECLMRSAKVTSKLADSLGEDTANLTLRFGMHSGPVTGGVLRGAKARFQLFGDTVNTAARMETTGEPSKIHISETTAKLLRKAGKEDWIRQREEVVEAKGKGSLQTYWLEPHSVDISHAGSTSSGGMYQHHQTSTESASTQSMEGHMGQTCHSEEFRSSNQTQIQDHNCGSDGHNFVPQQED